MLLGVGPQFVWTSGNDLGNEGNYEWGFNSGDPVEFGEWVPGQPNEWYCTCDNGVTVLQDCLAVDAAYQYELMDAECYFPAEPLCQYNP